MTRDDKTQPIVLDAALDAPPPLVWRALTEPALLARWLAPNDIKAEVGRRFTVRPDGPIGAAPIDCEVLAIEPERLLSYRWRGGEGDAALDTVVTWVLEPTAEGGTRLRLVHDGFPIVLDQPFVPSPLAGEGGTRACKAREDEGSSSLSDRPGLQQHRQGALENTGAQPAKPLILPLLRNGPLPLPQGEKGLARGRRDLRIARRKSRDQRTKYAGERLSSSQGSLKWAA